MQIRLLIRGAGPHSRQGAARDGGLPELHAKARGEWRIRGGALLHAANAAHLGWPGRTADYRDGPFEEGRGGWGGRGGRRWLRVRRPKTSKTHESWPAEFPPQVARLKSAYLPTHRRSDWYARGPVAALCWVAARPCQCPKVDREGRRYRAGTGELRGVAGDPHCRRAAIARARRHDSASQCGEVLVDDGHSRKAPRSAPGLLLLSAGTVTGLN